MKGREGRPGERQSWLQSAFGSALEQHDDPHHGGSRIPHISSAAGTRACVEDEEVVAVTAPVAPAEDKEAPPEGRCDGTRSRRRCLASRRDGCPVFLLCRGRKDGRRWVGGASQTEVEGKDVVK